VPVDNRDVEMLSEPAKAWFIYRSQIKAWVAGNTVRSLAMRAIPQRFCDEVAF